MPKFIDLSNRVFGRLTVIKRSSNDSHGGARWVCRCECGNECIVQRANLTRGRAKSCGCLQKEIATRNNTKHGCASNSIHTSEYNTWQDMKQRCLNPNTPNYQDYGGRGITVCDRWLHSFENFFADVGVKPGTEYSIERKDVNGNYEPDNCIWASKTAQSRNRRVRKDSSSGVRGVMWYKRKNKWHVQIRVKGKSVHIGYFKVKSEAIEARKQAEKKYWNDEPSYMDGFCCI